MGVTHPSQGGLPHPFQWGYPNPSQRRLPASFLIGVLPSFLIGGTSILPDGVPPSRFQVCMGGYPDLERATPPSPSPDLGRGVPLPQSRPGKELPPIQTWEGDTPPSRSGPKTGWGVYPLLEQHSVYLLRGMPFAFTQEDFLVQYWVWFSNSKLHT